MPEFICENITASEGRLCFAGQDTVQLAKQYGTPLYLVDEDRVRRNCRVYTDAFRKYLPEGSLPLYAGKANAFKQMFRIVHNEGMGLDTVSCGEICTALAAGVPAGKLYFHSNNKTDGDIAFAVSHGVGCFVVESGEEVLAIEDACRRESRIQQVMLRVTPGIDPHTYAAVSTGKVDSKFGAAVETGQAEELTALILKQKHLKLIGFHCHIGSMVFAEDVFERSVEVMLDFIADMREKIGYTPEWLNLGGGYGVRYVPEDGHIDIGEKIRSVGETLRAGCQRRRLPLMKIMMEPGRSICADAGMTLYTVGSVKRIPGYKSYVSVDGGMTDNPRYALYGARHMSYCASRMDEPAEFTADLVGRCCESDDVIAPDARFPESIRRGDIAAVCTTGAYCYAMASHYNRIPKPPVVMLSAGESYVAVRRETEQDMYAYDL